MDEHWYHAPKKDAHEKVIATYGLLVNQQTDKTQADVDHLRLYGSLDIAGFGSSVTFQRTPPQRTKNRVAWNVTQSVTDTLVSKIGKNKPRPLFLTSGGDWALRHRAELLTKFTYGQFQTLDLYTLSRDIFRDACIFGTGILKVYHEGGKCKVERVLPIELWVDEVESIYGEPRQMFQRKTISREVLLAAYPQHRKAIEGASVNQHLPSLVSSDRISDQVDIVEAWHLPSGPEATDGRHVIAIDGATLLDQPWERDHFPFVFFRWLKRPVGFWGQGVCEQLAQVQLEINKILYKIQRSFELLAVPWVFVEKTSEIPKGHINNQLGNIIRFNRVAPQVHTHATVHPEVFQHLERLYQRSYEIVGLSQLSAAAKKPAGVESGVALREMNDIETERFQEIGQNWEVFFLDIAKQLIEVAQEIAVNEGDYSSTIKDRDFFERIKWSDIDLEEDQYELSLFPVSLLPTKPEGRLERIQEMMKSGIIDPQEGKDLLDVPDLERHTDLERAHRDIIQQTVERMLETGVYTAPETFDDLGYAMKFTINLYHKARLDGVDEARLELLRQYIADVQALMDSLKPPEPPPGAPQ